MWLGPLHDPIFIEKMLASLDEPDRARFNTLTRIKGMLTIAKNVSVLTQRHADAC